MEVVKAKKAPLPERVAKFLLPKKLHKYATVEALIAWKLGGLFSYAQIAVVEHWGWLVAKVFIPVAHVSKLVWKETVLVSKAVTEAVIT